MNTDVRSYDDYPAEMFHFLPSLSDASGFELNVHEQLTIDGTFHVRVVKIGKTIIV